MLSRSRVAKRVAVSVAAAPERSGSDCNVVMDTSRSFLHAALLRRLDTGRGRAEDAPRRGNSDAQLLGSHLLLSPPPSLSHSLAQDAHSYRHRCLRRSPRRRSLGVRTARHLPWHHPRSVSSSHFSSHPPNPLANSPLTPRRQAHCTSARTRPSSSSTRATRAPRRSSSSRRVKGPRATRPCPTSRPSDPCRSSATLRPRTPSRTRSLSRSQPASRSMYVRPPPSPSGPASPPFSFAKRLIQSAAPYPTDEHTS